MLARLQVDGDRSFGTLARCSFESLERNPRLGAFDHHGSILDIDELETFWRMGEAKGMPTATIRINGDFHTRLSNVTFIRAPKGFCSDTVLAHRPYALPDALVNANRVRETIGAPAKMLE